MQSEESKKKKSSNVIEDLELKVKAWRAMLQKKIAQKYLKSIKLPLSQEDYKTLQKLKHTEQITYSDMSTELRRAYDQKGSKEAGERIEKLRELGKLGAFED